MLRERPLRHGTRTRRDVLALEIGPVAQEYGLRNSGSPIVWYKMGSRPILILCDEFVRLGEELGFGAQRAVYSRAGTDASVARQDGQAGRIACLGFPAEIPTDTNWPV